MLLLYLSIYCLYKIKCR